MPAIYIHIGQHKTGTSSLQRFCTVHREELARRFGLYYPESPDGEDRHRALFFPFRAPAWKRVREQAHAAACPNVLISNESLYSHAAHAARVAQIQHLFPDHEIFFILYLRRIDDYCLSWYKQCLRRGHPSSVTYAHFLQDTTRHPLRLHPLRVLRQYERLVGRDHLLVRAYDPSALKNGNIVDDFFDLLGITLPGDMDRNRIFNPSLPDAALPYVTEALRRASFKDPVNTELRRKLMRAFTPSERADVSPEFLASLSKEIRRIDKLYLPGYTQLHAGRPLDFSSPAPEADPRDLLIVDLLYSILFELRHRKSLAHRMELFAKDALHAAHALFHSLCERLQRKK